MTTPNPDDIVVEHDAAAQQFHAQVNGMRSVLQYRRAPGKIFFVHTEVPAELRHRGIADALAHAGLEYARSERLTVIPLCPFVAAYIQRHPAYQPLVETQ